MKKILAIIFVLSACAQETNKRSAKLENSGDQKETKILDSRYMYPGDGHDRGLPVPDLNLVSPTTQKQIDSMLKMSPLADGHMITDMFAANRPVNPTKQMGLWSLGLKWSTADLGYYLKANSLSLSFEAISGQNYQCRLDNNAWESCAGTMSYQSITEGFHEVAVRSAATNIILGGYRFKVDTISPKVFAAFNSQSKKYKIISNELLSKVDCGTLDCSKDFDKPASGKISITATDAAGNEFKGELGL